MSPTQPIQDCNAAATNVSRCMQHLKVAAATGVLRQRPGSAWATNKAGAAEQGTSGAAVDGGQKSRFDVLASAPEALDGSLAVRARKSRSVEPPPKGSARLIGQPFGRAGRAG
eukprot:15479595-Alexandrium_andersonii.AAC.1